MRLTLITSCAAALLIAIGTPHPADAQVAGVMPAVAVAAVVTQSQPPTPVNVDIKLGDGRTVWYANPVWIVVGLLAVVVLGLVIGMAARGGGGEGTTIVK